MTKSFVKHQARWWRLHERAHRARSVYSFRMRRFCFGRNRSCSPHMKETKSYLPLRRKRRAIIMARGFCWSRPINIADMWVVISQMGSAKWPYWKRHPPPESLPANEIKLAMITSYHWMWLKPKRQGCSFQLCPIPEDPRVLPAAAGPSRP